MTGILSVRLPGRDGSVGSSSSAQPGRDDDPEDPQRVGEPRGLLRLACDAGHHGDGDLVEAQLVPEALQRDLVRVEAVLAEVHLVEFRDPDGAVAVRAVRDLDAGEDRDQAREKHDAYVPDAPGLLVEPHETRAEDEVRLILDDRAHQPVQLFGLVLPVGVQVHDGERPLGLRYGEAGPEGVALAPVDDVGDDGHALGPRVHRRGVLRAVVHDHGLYRVAEDLVWDAPEDAADAALLVVGRHDYEDLVRVAFELLLMGEELLRVVPDGEARDDLAGLAARGPHPPQHVQKQREQQQVGEPEQGEGAVLEAEQSAHGLEDLRHHRDEGHAEGYEQGEEQVEPAPPAAELEDAVRREEQSYNDAGDAYVFGLQHRILPRALLLVHDFLGPPQRGGGNLRGIAAVGVLAGYLGNLFQQPFA